MSSTARIIIDLGEERERRDSKLADAVVRYAAEQSLPVDHLVRMILGCALGNQWVDDELEENIVMGLAAEIGREVRNPRHEINGAGECEGGENDGRG